MMKVWFFDEAKAIRKSAWDDLNSRLSLDKKSSDQDLSRAAPLIGKYLEIRGKRMDERGVKDILELIEMVRRLG